MLRFRVSLTMVAVVAGVTIVGCTQAAPAPTTVPAPPAKAVEPTKAPAAAPTKPAEPTKAPAAQPTAVPAKKVDWPEKGKNITMIVPYAAGGAGDVMARLIGPFLEQDLGVPIQVVNKPGASSQVGLTELAKSKPDGYTLGNANLPAAMTIYLDPERKSAFGRQDLQPVTVQARETCALSVKADSPYKVVKDYVDAAKANPTKVKAGTTGYMGSNHLPLVQLEEMAGVKFAPVHFDGTAPGLTAVLGGHIDGMFAATSSPVVAAAVSGQTRILGIMDKAESKFLPGVKTFEAQGFPLLSYVDYTWNLPAGTPREIVNTYGAAFKKASENPEYRKKMEDAGVSVYYMDPDQLVTYWTNEEPKVKKLMDLAKEQR